MGPASFCVHVLGKDKSKVQGAELGYRLHCEPLYSYQSVLCYLFILFASMHFIELFFSFIATTFSL